MTIYNTPGVYVEEIPKLPPSVSEVSTAVPAFIGCTANGPTLENEHVVPIVKRINTLLEYEMLFGGPKPSAFTVTVGPEPSYQPIQISRDVPSDFDPILYYCLSLYFKNGGGSCYVVSIGNYNAAPAKSQFIDGLDALEKEDEPTLILLTDAVKLSAGDYYDLAQQALDQCAKLRDRFAVLDVLDHDGVEAFRAAPINKSLMYGAAYYPSVETTLTYAFQEDQVTIKFSDNQGPDMMDAIKSTKTALYNQVKAAVAQQRVNLPSSSAVAGIYASVDRDRGVWKAPANVSLSSVIGPLVKITHNEQDKLNVDPTAGKSINAIRAFTGKGTLVWGARTLAGNDNEWRYVSVRRLFNMIEESTQKATSFAVFEPNDATTWLKVKAMIESYLYGLWQQGALAGPTPDDAYFVNVGLGKTMTPQDVLEGRLIVEIGVAAVRPAEFIILRFMHKLQQA